MRIKCCYLRAGGRKAPYRSLVSAGEVSPKGSMWLQQS